MTLLLVRHAESSGNAAGRIQGWTDTPLAPAGEAQAAALGARLSTLPIDAVYASPLARARDTARAIASPHGLDVIAIDDLRERNYGQAQGLTWGEASTRWPVPEATHDDDWAAAIPDVESVPALRARGVAAVDALLTRHVDGVVVCVSHGGTIAQVVAHVLALPPGTWPRVRISNTSVTVIEGTAEAPVLRTFNDICHLDPEQRRNTLAL